MTVITRFPPSPTGYLHIGRARTALFNYLFTKKNKGTMIFRIEDTDKERSKKEYEENIIECLEWLGITYDEGPIRQSERNDIYKKYIAKLIESGHAYISKETIEAAPTGAANTGGAVTGTPANNREEGGAKNREEVIRFKNPKKKISFTDLIRGEIEFDTTDLGDFVIARSLEEPLYHLTVVVDDHEMGITHVIRGDDGISNTPRQILIQEAIGAARPLYAHIPLILAPDKSKLSGRHGAVSVSEYRTAGYLPEAVINFLGLCGWNPGTEQELFTMAELVDAFDLSKVQKSGAVFNIDKLNWFNRQYITKLTDADFTSHAASFVPEWLSTTGAQFARIIPLLKEKVVTFAEVSTILAPAGELGFIRSVPEYAADLLLWKKNPSTEKAREHLAKAAELLGAIPADSFTAEGVKAALWAYAETHSKGDVLWPLRVALTGKEKSPDPFVSAFILGKEESLRRIEAAITKLS